MFILPRTIRNQGAAERVVQTLKCMLTANVAGAMHDWPSMLPTLRMEYMQRRHSTTGYSPNELVFATEAPLPPPVGELHWTARTGAIIPDVLVRSGPLTQTPGHYLRTAHSVPKSHIIKYMIAYCKLSAITLSARLPSLCVGQGGEELAVGDLAYLLTKIDGFKTTVNSPFVVCELFEWHAELRTSGALHGQ